MKQGPARAFETRLPCPVCLGVMLEKTRLVRGATTLVLDSCRRCGGIWFEAGEVRALRGHAADDLWHHFERRAQPHRGPCHGCQAIIDRNADRCEACGAENRINCPQCDEPLRVDTHEGLRLDICTRCHGVWFDHVELDALWRINLEARRPHREMLSGGEVAGLFALDALTYSPDLLFVGARAAGMAVEGATHAVGSAPELAVGAVEVVGDAASGVFEAIVEIISGIFS